MKWYGLKHFLNCIGNKNRAYKKKATLRAWNDKNYFNDFDPRYIPNHVNRDEIVITEKSKLIDHLYQLLKLKNEIRKKSEIIQNDYKILKGKHFHYKNETFEIIAIDFFDEYLVDFGLVKLKKVKDNGKLSFFNKYIKIIDFYMKLVDNEIVFEN